MRLVFAGTPAAALPTLDALLKSRHQVAAVVTRPDAKAGRGQKLVRSPIAERAADAGIEVLRPVRPSEPDFLARLREIGPDCCPVTAYGALIPQAALDIPAQGWINLHFSVLPAWRGAAPVQHAIMHGDDVTGATTFRIVRELDAGPVFGVLTEPIRPSDTAGDLLDRLSISGAELLVATLDGIESGELEAREQQADGVSLAPKITPADAEINWRQPAIGIDRQIRACTPEPGAWTQLDGVRVKLWPVTMQAGISEAGARTSHSRAGTSEAQAGMGQAQADGPDASALAAGELRVQRNRVLAGTGSSPVELGEVQADGKRRMRAADWARGLHSGGRPLVLG
jgi:methionyl-tRNA formyltransferase